MDNLLDDENGESLVSRPIEEGEYPLRYLGHEYLPKGFNGQPKIYLNFEIAYGPNAGMALKRIYNVDNMSYTQDGKKRTRWKAPRRGDLRTEFLLMFESVLERPEAIRLHTIPLSKYSEYTVIGYVEMQKKDQKGRRLSKLDARPIVRELLRIDRDDTSSMVRLGDSPSGHSPFGSQTPATPTTPYLPEGGVDRFPVSNKEGCVYTDAEREQQKENAEWLLEGD